MASQTHINLTRSSVLPRPVISEQKRTIEEHLAELRHLREQELVSEEDITVSAMKSLADCKRQMKGNLHE